MSGSNEGVQVNGLLSGAKTSTTNFTAYISPYLVLNNGGYYSKHIYIGSQRVTSKLGSSDIFATNPLTDTKAYSVDFTVKQSVQTAKVKERYDSLAVVYKGTSQGSAGMETSVGSRIATPMKYFYHSDHLGSSSLITDGGGSLVQHIEYVPFGEVFVEERNTGWSTPYKFNGKEMDEETGLYYYGARYMDPRTSVWLSVDPLAEKFPSVSSYVYCLGNPIKFIDKDGRKPSAKESALMAKAAYHDKDYDKVIKKLEKMHWKVSSLKTEFDKNANWNGNGYNTELFEKTTNGKTEYSYAFAGTDSPEDGAQDIAQPAGLSSQYATAIKNARSLSGQLKSSELTFVGHSLGGGEAAAASMATGRVAITFNPAAVGKATEWLYNLGSAKNVVNYVTMGIPVLEVSWGGKVRHTFTMGGDPLNNFQNNVGLSAPGHSIQVPTNSAAWSHGIDNFLDKNLPEHK